MATAPHEFVTVDMRDLKSALIASSRIRRVSVSSLIRDYVATGLGLAAPEVEAEPLPSGDSRSRVKVAIRMTGSEAHRFAQGAKRAGISRAAYLAELIAGAPHAIDGATRIEQMALLAAANAELSTHSRNVRHLASLLNQGSVEAAREYKVMLDGMADDVRLHLSLSTRLLAELRSRHGVVAPSRGHTRHSRRARHA